MTATTTPRRSYVDTSWGQIHVRECGSGRPLLLLHQAGRSGRMFHDLMIELSRDHRVVALDLPGFGTSDPPTGDYDMDDLAGLCVEVMDALHEGPWLMYGHHSGNKLAVAIARAHPERVESLVLAGQSHSIIPDHARRNDAITGYTSPYTSTANPADAQWLGTLRSWVATWSQGAGVGPEGNGVRERVARELADLVDGLPGTGALYRANVAYDFGGAAHDVETPTLVLEIVTPEEERAWGRQGPALADCLRRGSALALEHPDGVGITLESRPGELAGFIRVWFGTDPVGTPRADAPPRSDHSLENEEMS